MTYRNHRTSLGLALMGLAAFLLAAPQVAAAHDDERRDRADVRRQERHSHGGDHRVAAREDRRREHRDHAVDRRGDRHRRHLAAHRNHRHRQHAMTDRKHRHRHKVAQRHGAFLCKPHQKRFHARWQFHRHLRRHHHVAPWKLSRRIHRNHFGWFFRG